METRRAHEPAHGRNVLSRGNRAVGILTWDSPSRADKAPFAAGRAKGLRLRPSRSREGGPAAWRAPRCHGLFTGPLRSHIRKPQEVALPEGRPAPGPHSRGSPFTGRGGPPSWGLCIPVAVASCSPLKSDSEGHPEADEHSQPAPPPRGSVRVGDAGLPPFAMGLPRPLEPRRLGPPSSAWAQQGRPH